MTDIVGLGALRTSDIGGEPLYTGPVELTREMWARMAVLAEVNDVEPGVMLERLLMRALSQLRPDERRALFRFSQPAGSSPAHGRVHRRRGDGD